PTRDRELPQPVVDEHRRQSRPSRQQHDRGVVRRRGTHVGDPGAVARLGDTEVVPFGGLPGSLGPHARQRTARAARPVRRAMTRPDAPPCAASTPIARVLITRHPTRPGTRDGGVVGAVPNRYLPTLSLDPWRSTR